MRRLFISIIILLNVVTLYGQKHVPSKGYMFVAYNQKENTGLFVTHKKVASRKQGSNIKTLKDPINALIKDRFYALDNGDIVYFDFKGFRWSSDMGKTWSDTVLIKKPKVFPVYAGSLRKYMFVNRMLGYVWYEDGTLFKTTDGGKTYDLITELNKGFNAKPYKHDVVTAHFFDNGIGFMIGYRSYTLRDKRFNIISEGKEVFLYRTSDGGNSWSEGTSPYVGTVFNQVPYFTQEKNNIWITVQGESNCYKSIDYGRSWVLIKGQGAFVTLP
jgi:photosystem II stability/assembly factor-like uncharacterized protein